MESQEDTFKKIDLRMANEDYYRAQAKSYRSSKTYSHMTRLYPTLQETINDCKEEKLIN